jgi:hypothetical protein
MLFFSFFDEITSDASKPSGKSVADARRGLAGRDKLTDSPPLGSMTAMF